MKIQIRILVTLAIFAVSVCGKETAEAGPEWTRRIDSQTIFVNYGASIHSLKSKGHDPVRLMEQEILKEAKLLQEAFRDRKPEVLVSLVASDGEFGLDAVRKEYTKKNELELSQPDLAFRKMWAEDLKTCNTGWAPLCYTFEVVDFVGFQNTEWIITVEEGASTSRVYFVAIRDTTAPVKHESGLDIFAFEKVGDAYKIVFPPYRMEGATLYDPRTKMVRRLPSI